MPPVAGDPIGLPHVTDVEQTRARPGPGVLFEYAACVLDWHSVARERHDPRAELDVLLVQRRWLQRGRCIAGRCGHNEAPKRSRAHLRTPSVLVPERLDDPAFP